MKRIIQNQDCKLILAYPLTREGDMRRVYLKKPDGTLRCIGTLMGTLKQGGSYEKVHSRTA